MVYVNYFQRPRYASQFTIVLRGRGDPATLIAAMRREARALNPEMPTDFQTLEQLVSASLDNRRFSMTMFGLFSGSALALAMVGLYGVMAYITSERTHEIGIRMALGAQRVDMLRMILRQSFPWLMEWRAAFRSLPDEFNQHDALWRARHGVLTYAGWSVCSARAARPANPARRAESRPMVAMRHEC